MNKISGWTLIFKRCLLAAFLLAAGTRTAHPELQAGAKGDPISNSNPSRISHLVVGVPFENLEPTDDAGTLNIIVGLPGEGLTSQGDYLLNQGSAGIEDNPESNDQFGSALVSADFNGDGISDLAVGVEGETILVECGAVHIFYGRLSGGFSSSNDRIFHQDSTGMPDECEEEDKFGSALAAGDFDSDGFDDLAIGIHSEDIVSGVTNLADAGAVQILYGSSAGLDITDNWFFTQTGSDLTSQDSFGRSLAAGDFNYDGYSDLAVGAPNNELLPAFAGPVGQVNILYGSGSGLTRTGEQTWNQDSPGVPGSSGVPDYFGYSLAAGDFDDDGMDDLAIGVYGDSDPGVYRAGAVNILFGDGSGLSAEYAQLIYQGFENGSGDISGLPEDQDGFGFCLSSGDFDKDGADDLVVGVPFEDIGDPAKSNAGAVHVIYGSISGLLTIGDQLWTLDDPNLPDSSQEFDTFGYSLSSGDFDADGYADLAIGVPEKEYGAVSNAGMVTVMYGEENQLTATGSQQWSQAIPPEIEGVAETDDYFGSALGVIDNPPFHLYLPLVQK